MYNPYLVTPLATWAIAQVLKFAIAAFKGRLDFKNLYASGGMPSVHSAVVTSLAVTALLVDGSGSHLFGFTAVFAVIVIYDSLGVRRAAGDQAIALNVLMAEASKGKSSVYKPLREVLGHTPAEVAAGTVLGAVLAAVFAYDKLGWLSAGAMALPAKAEYTAYGITGISLIVVGILVRILLPLWKRNSVAIAGVAKNIFRILQGTGWLVIVAAILEYEQASYLAWRMWPVITLTTGAVLLILAIVRSMRTLPIELAVEAETQRKAKWFSWKNGRKKTKSKKV